MDKYEFNMKVEQIRKLVSKGDYETAMKITDTIDWKKVRNASVLSMVSGVYEKNEEYQDAKEILLLAFERAPVGKRFLYKLTELALKEGNPDEAETYYREFCDLAPEDPRQHLLRYMILQAKQAPAEQLIHSLERYNAEELEEEWLYELAELYHQVGDGQNCVRTCDKLVLMFGLGKYVDKAMELKQEYAPLTSHQIDLMENRGKYEAKLREVELSYTESAEPKEEEKAEEPVKEAEAPAAEAGEAKEEAPVPAAVAEEQLIQEATQAETEDALKQEMSKMAETSYQDAPESELGKTRILKELRRKNTAEEASAVDSVLPVQQAEPVKEMPSLSVELDETAEEEEEPKQPQMKNHLMIEARTPEKGLAMAVETLKKIQKETGVKNPVAKITGSKLSKRGVYAVADKLAGKDLMIEEAGDMSEETIRELEQFMLEAGDSIRVILIDNPRQMEQLHAQNPSFASNFECIAGAESAAAEEPAPAAEPAKPAEEEKPAVKAEPEKPAEEEAKKPKKEAPKKDTRPVRKVDPVREEPAVRKKPAKPPVEDEPEEEETLPLDNEEELDIDDFAQYACQYAESIDCSITGKSMLALYERIEIMEEDGIPLTRANAAALIEEAADKAEKPGFIKGIFSSKYNKAGKLILKEEHFIS